MKRDHDLTFGVTEKLWRRIGKQDVNASGVRPGSLRLQISVVRERHGTIETVPEGDRTGVAETEASQVAAVCNQAVRVVCVDDPDDAQPGHALIALVANPGEEAPQDCVNATRAMIATKLRVVVPPSAK